MVKTEAVPGLTAWTATTEANIVIDVVKSLN